MLLIVCPVCLLLRNNQTNKSLAKPVGDLVLRHFRAVGGFKPHCEPFYSQQSCVCYLLGNMEMQLKLFFFLVRCMKSEIPRHFLQIDL